MKLVKNIKNSKMKMTIPMTAAAMLAALGVGTALTNGHANADQTQSGQTQAALNNTDANQAMVTRTLNTGANQPQAPVQSSTNNDSANNDQSNQQSNGGDQITSTVANAIEHNAQSQSQPKTQLGAEENVQKPEATIPSTPDNGPELPSAAAPSLNDESIHSLADENTGTIAPESQFTGIQASDRSANSFTGSEFIDPALGLTDNNDSADLGNNGNLGESPNNSVAAMLSNPNGMSGLNSQVTGMFGDNQNSIPTPDNTLADYHNADGSVHGAIASAVSMVQNDNNLTAYQKNSAIGNIDKAAKITVNKINGADKDVKLDPFINNFAGNASTMAAAANSLGLRNRSQYISMADQQVNESRDKALVAIKSADLTDAQKIQAIGQINLATNSKLNEINNMDGIPRTLAPGLFVTPYQLLDAAGFVRGLGEFTPQTNNALLLRAARLATLRHLPTSLAVPGVNEADPLREFEASLAGKNVSAPASGNAALPFNFRHMGAEVPFDGPSINTASRNGDNHAGFNSNETDDANYADNEARGAAVESGHPVRSTGNSVQSTVSPRYHRTARRAVYQVAPRHARHAKRTYMVAPRVHSMRQVTGASSIMSRGNMPGSGTTIAGSSMMTGNAVHMGQHAVSSPVQQSGTRGRLPQTNEASMNGSFAMALGLVMLGLSLAGADVLRKKRTA